MSLPEPVYQAVDPATGAAAERFPHASAAEIEAALRNAHAAFLGWRERAVEDRAEILRQISSALLAHASELAGTMRAEMGKPVPEGIEEVEYCASIFRYYTEEGPALLSDEHLPASGGRAKVQSRPIGPLLGVMPWNFPCYQVARFAAPNLLLGNTVLVKPAESVPGTSLAFARILREAGLPDGCCRTVFATHGQIEDIIADPRVQGVSLTGSERAGSAVAAAAGRHVKKCVLELGGSDPFVVLDAEDVPGLAELAWRTRMYNNGQACTSNKRLLVAAGIYDEFVAALVKLAEAVDPETHPPLASRAVAERVAGQVSDAVSRGARLLAGGRLASDGSARFSPAVLVDVAEDMRAWHEELFGPVAVVYRVRDEDHAVELANSSEYGLGGAVFSADPERAARVAQRLDVGMVSINAASGDGPGLPFGGIKRSGFGRELGAAGLGEFANKRLVYEAAADA
ncbi:aldehyde dehydrogenase family protein [Amycolatopsis orientalis]|uniref:aldehyde dehydrogenase family protein n=1 Tax=Amycolatopsis orientalis TaxID=31958 RepID=UPI00039D6DE8|nr:aldehyde dehydrogenase family protein [Amycolatopsis orientalis]